MPSFAMETRMETEVSKVAFCKRSLVVYAIQVLAIFIMMIVSVANLSLGGRGDKEMWLTLLCTSMGYLLPNPKVKRVVGNGSP